MDVHDVGAYFVDGKPRALAPGMVLTVEPGIYIAPGESSVAPEWRGIGVRIEDDVLVTESEPQVLTAGIPKAVDEVRRAGGGGAAAATPPPLPRGPPPPGPPTPPRPHRR